MKTRNLISLAATTLLVSACIPSLNPFYTAKDVVFDTHLVGIWQTKNAGEDQRWKFEQGKDNSYQLKITEKDGKEGKFTAHLFKLKQELFLDLIPSDCGFSKDQADLVGCAMFPGHLLVRVAQLGLELKLAMTDFDWLSKYLEANPKALAHHTEEERVLLTASTRDLQRFVLKHLGKGELFGEPSVMVRKAASAGN